MLPLVRHVPLLSTTTIYIELDSDDVRGYNSCLIYSILAWKPVYLGAGGSVCNSLWYKTCQKKNGMLIVKSISLLYKNTPAILHK